MKTIKTIIWTVVALIALSTSAHADSYKITDTRTAQVNPYLTRTMVADVLTSTTAYMVQAGLPTVTIDGVVMMDKRTTGAYTNTLGCAYQSTIYLYDVENQTEDYYKTIVRHEYTHVVANQLINASELETYKGILSKRYLNKTEYSENDLYLIKVEEVLADDIRHILTGYTQRMVKTELVKQLTDSEEQQLLEMLKK